MNGQQERHLGELAESFVRLTDELRFRFRVTEPEDLENICDELYDAADDLWTVWREVQVEKDLATCR
jgi:hypothetical protein